MDFSIIIPVYNVSNYLRECIESIIAQDKIDYEIILVDDGSKDQSGPICDEYADKYDFISVIHKENGGLSDARNAGIFAAKGDYVLFIDGDDKIEKNSLSHILQVIQDQEYPDVVCLELVKFFENSTETIAMGDGIDERINHLQNDQLYEYLATLPKYPASACTKAIKRELFTLNDLRFVKGLLSEDLEWGIRLFLAADTFAYCSNKYYYYRQARTGSISNTPSEKKVLDIMETYTKWTNYAKSVGIPDKKRMICSYMEYVFRFLILYYNCIETDKRRSFKQMVSDSSWVIGTRKDKVSKCIAISYRIFGIRLTGVFLRKYLNVRGY